MKKCPLLPALLEPAAALLHSIIEKLFEFKGPEVLVFVLVRVLLSVRTAVSLKRICFLSFLAAGLSSIFVT